MKQSYVQPQYIMSITNLPRKGVAVVEVLIPSRLGSTLAAVALKVCGKQRGDMTSDTHSLTPRSSCSRIANTINLASINFACVTRMATFYSETIQITVVQFRDYYVISLSINLFEYF